jgi:hypothetical protein
MRDLSHHPVAPGKTLQVTYAPRLGHRAGASTRVASGGFACGTIVLLQPLRGESGRISPSRLPRIVISTAKATEPGGESPALLLSYSTAIGTGSDGVSSQSFASSGAST